VLPVLPAPSYIVSDAHLGASPPRAEDELLALLAHVRTAGGSLVVNGDLFDFWFEWRTVIPRRAFRVLAALRALTDRGIPIVWTAGNHDCWGGEVLRNDVGVWYQVDPWEGEIAGWRARVEHGDGLRDEEDRNYRRIRPIMRNRLAIRAFRALHPDLATRIAVSMSGTSREHGAPDEGEALRAVAFATLSRRSDVDLLVYGHSHICVVERGPHGVYANAGGWMERPTYLVVTPERISLREWNGSAEGLELDAVDRSAEEPFSDAEKV
jgi:UDP-2,3-diacylglucosamine hydrolase